MPPLICPDCGKIFSDSLAACPGCCCAAVTASPAKKARAPGVRFADRYELCALLADGPGGEIWKARDGAQPEDSPDAFVALRFLPPRITAAPRELSRLHRAFHKARRLSHPSIAQVYDFARGDEAEAIVSELVEGENLADYRRRNAENEPFPYDEACRVCFQAAEALDYAHGQSVYHQDIRPQNIVITPEGDVKLLYFGIAAEIRGPVPGMDGREAALARPYAAPEQWDGKPHRYESDQYSLAVVFYELIAGTRPFDNPDLAILRKMVAEDDPPMPAALPHEAVPAMRRALSKKPGKRFPGCEEMVEALAGPDIAEVDVEELEREVPLVVWDWLADYSLGLDMADAQGNTLMHYAARDGRLDVAKWLAGEGLPSDSASTEGYKPIHEAAANNHLEVLRWLEENGSGLDDVTEYGETPLELAANNNAVDVVGYLLDKGVDVAARNRDSGVQAIHAAALGGAVDALQLLFDRGAEVNAVSGGGLTPLDFASVVGPGSGRDCRAAEAWLREHGGGSGVSGDTKVFVNPNRQPEAKEDIAKGKSWWRRLFR